MAAVRKDAGRSQAEREKFAQKYAAAALGRLGRARGAGAFAETAALDRLKADDDFAAPGGQAKFDQFREELGKTAAKH